MLHGLARASRMASFRYDSVGITETGLAREGGFGQSNLSNWSNILASLHADPDRDENYYWVTACNSAGCSEIDSGNPAAGSGGSSR